MGIRLRGKGRAAPKLIMISGKSITRARYRFCVTCSELRRDIAKDLGCVENRIAMFADCQQVAEASHTVPTESEITVVISTDDATQPSDEELRCKATQLLRTRLVNPNVSTFGQFRTALERGWGMRAGSLGKESCKRVLRAESVRRELAAINREILAANSVHPSALHLLPKLAEHNHLPGVLVNELVAYLAPIHPASLLAQRS